MLTSPRTGALAAAPLSPLTLGTSAWRRAIERGNDPTAVLDAVLSGSTAPAMTVIDTSNEYSGGLSEELIGRALAEHGGAAGDVLIATKLDRDPVTGDFSGERMRRSLAESLERLGLRSLPLLYLHDPENMTYSEAFGAGGAVEALVAMKDEGLADAIGISGGPVPMLRRYVETGLFDALITHNRFTLVDRSADALLDLATERAMTVFNAAPYGSAPLARWPEPVTDYAYRPAHPLLAASVEAMGLACADAGVPLAAAALQFSARDERVASTVVGINSTAQLERTLEWLEVDIPEDLWGRLESLAPPSDAWQDPPGPSPWDDFPYHLTERA